MTNNEKYLMHCSGVYSLMGWLRELQLQGIACEHHDNEFKVHPIVARRIGLGVARGKNTNNSCFLAIQSNEHKWMKLIRWEKLYIKKNDPNLYLVSKIAKGDQDIYPDIPSFRFIIPIDNIAKLDILNGNTKLEARELTFNEDGQMIINFSSKIFNIIVKYLEENEEIPLPNESLFSSRDVIFKKEAFAMSTENIEFIGDTASSSKALQEYQKQIAAINKEWQYYK